MQYNMNDKNQEYLFLREEIMQKFVIQNNAITLTYTVTITVLGFAFSQRNYYPMFPYLFLLPLIIIVPNIFRIVVSNNEILKISAYLIVFHENSECCHIKWEGYNYKFELFLRQKKKKKATWLQIIFNSLHVYSLWLLEMLCVLLYFSTLILNKAVTIYDLFILLGLTVLSLVCFIHIKNNNQWCELREVQVKQWEQFKNYSLINVAIKKDGLIE